MRDIIRDRYGVAKGTDVHEHWVNAKKWAYQVTWAMDGQSRLNHRTNRTWTKERRRNETRKQPEK